ncbi:MAG: hypothetical protein V4463_03170 [Pseudomonadota bacterium]
MEHTIKKGALIAAAAAAMALSGQLMASETAAVAADAVHCTGINSCKGTSDCKTAENACKGQNVCKGHGFLTTTKAECAKKGGKVAEAK